MVKDRDHTCLPNTINAHFDIDPIRFAGESMVDGIRMLTDPATNPVVADEVDGT